MTKRPTLKISKTDAAKRQLETAIRLWFFSGEPVSIHTLATAAHQVLHDLGKKRGVPAILRELAGIVRPEFKKRIDKLVTRDENFFKHADRDPDALLDFNPEATEIYLLDAVITYEGLTQEMVPIFSTFKMWMFIQHPELIEEKTRENATRLLNSINANFALMPKAEFFTLFQTAFMKSGLI